MFIRARLFWRLPVTLLAVGRSQDAKAQTTLASLVY